MKQLFDKVSTICSKVTTRAYSTSFSLGIRFLDKKLHTPIYSIYGFVRFADEIVDSFHDYDKETLLTEFETETWKAIQRKISLNPVLNSFQHVVHEYQIDHKLIECFLKSMRMDLRQTEHTGDSYNDYILGSAEVVGLMCLHVFTDGDRELYNKLKPFAMKLGAAFQKVNFLRDIRADYEVLGRTYFPDVDFKRFSHTEKEMIQQDIQKDFDYALTGIRMLPLSSRRGVYLAYFYYTRLFMLIKKTPAERILSARIRIPDHRKLTLMFQSVVRHQLNML